MHNQIEEKGEVSILSLYFSEKVFEKFVIYQKPPTTKKLKDNFCL